MTALAEDRRRERLEALRSPRAAERSLRSSPIDLHVAAGEFLAIVGPSGCGKSTLLNVIAGFETATSGQRRRSTAARSTSPGPERGVVFQEYALFPWLTVAGNIGVRPGEPAACRRTRSSERVARLR